MKKRPDDAEIVDKVELTHYKHTHYAEIIVNLSLFKLIRVTHEERLSNLMVLLNEKALEVCNFQKKWSSVKMTSENVTVVLPKIALFCENHEKNDCLFQNKSWPIISSFVHNDPFYVKIIKKNLFSM